MRSQLIASLLLLSSAAGHAAPQPQAGKGRTGMFHAAYDPPKNPKHQPLYEKLKKAQALERFGEALGAIRLPKPLLIKFAGCDGTSNAWYEPSAGTVTFCYEYVAALDQTSKTAVEKGIDPELAWQGSVAFILLHETSHALFHLLQVPILGREED